VPKVSDATPKAPNPGGFAGLRSAKCGLCRYIKSLGGSFLPFVSAVGEAIPGFVPYVKRCMGEKAQRTRIDLMRPASAGIFSFRAVSGAYALPYDGWALVNSGKR
jgi:hypothetical protein